MCVSRIPSRASAVGLVVLVASAALSCGKGVTDASSGSPNTVASVAVAPESVSIPITRTAQLEATLHNAAGDVISGRAVSWSSSNLAVAAVSTSGLATAVAVGNAVITATSNGKSGRADVTVVPTPVNRLLVTPSTASVASGSTQTFTATAYDADGSIVATPSVSWTSSNTGVATVSASGVASGVAGGLATISARSSDKTASATLAVVSAASCKLVDGAGAVRTSPLAKPGYLQSVIDPDFGTTITRISGDPGAPIPVVGGTWGTTVYGNYPKDPAWNADQSLLLLKHTGTSQAGFLFLDGETYRVLLARRGPSGVIDTLWHPTMPDIMLWVSADGSVSHWNVRTNTSIAKFRASGYSGASFGSYEGNPSRDGRYVAVQASRNSDGHVVAFVVDVDAGTRSGDVDLTAANITDLDWVSVSEGGGYVVAYGTIDGRQQRTKVWRRDGTAVGYWQDFTFGHYDLGLDAAGNEVAFGAVGQSPYAHHFVARRLDSGAITDVSGALTSFNWHATTRNTARSGWGYAATNDRTGYPLDGEIYAVKLDGSFTVERYAHHRANNIDYDSAPFPTPSPDGRRVLFASNWGEASGRPVQAYVVDTRQLCPNGLPQ